MAALKCPACGDAFEFPKLAGVAEVAALRGVTRGRAHQITRQPAFPRPVAELAAGPAWLESEVLEYLSKDRPPGRPRKSAPPEVPGAGGEQD